MNETIIETTIEELMPVINECLSSGKSFRFSPRGISMFPMLRQGKDSVLLSPVIGKLNKYDIPLYKRENGQYVLHRIVKVEETYTCIGDNQYVEEKDVAPDSVIAVVTAFYRGNKEYKTSYIPYRMYCVLWHYSRPVRHLLKRTKNYIKRKLFIK